MLDGHTYEAQVRAKDDRQQYSQPLNTSIIVESRSPATTGKWPVVHEQNGDLSVDWNQVFDVMNMDSTYVVSIGTRQGYADVINQLVTKETHVTTSTQQTLTGVYITIVAKIETGRFGLFSEFMILGAIERYHIKPSLTSRSYCKLRKTLVLLGPVSKVILVLQLS